MPSCREPKGHVDILELLDHDFWNLIFIWPCLESQVAEQARPLYPKVAQNLLNVFHNSGATGPPGRARILPPPVHESFLQDSLRDLNLEPWPVAQVTIRRAS